MPNPFEALIEMQRQTFASMQSMSRMWLTGWMRVFEQQSQMLDQAARRTEDKGPPQHHIAKGADLQDHYGKRARDVNVERI